MSYAIFVLCSKDLANFHRPKAVWYPHHNEVAAKEQGKLAVKGPMKVILKTLGGKGSKLSVDASETVAVLKVKAAKKLAGNPFSCACVFSFSCMVIVARSGRASRKKSMSC